jgi:hypothetical protein
MHGEHIKRHPLLLRRRIIWQQIKDKVGRRRGAGG